MSCSIRGQLLGDARPIYDSVRRHEVSIPVEIGVDVEGALCRSDEAWA